MLLPEPGYCTGSMLIPRREQVKHPEDKPESFSRSFIRMASAAHGAASEDVKIALPDVAYTTIFLSGIALTGTWADFMIPRVCPVFSPDASVSISPSPSFTPVFLSSSLLHSLSLSSLSARSHKHTLVLGRTPPLSSYS